MGKFNKIGLGIVMGSVFTSLGALTVNNTLDKIVEDSLEKAGYEEISHIDDSSSKFHKECSGLSTIFSTNFIATDKMSGDRVEGHICKRISSEKDKITIINSYKTNP